MTNVLTKNDLEQLLGEQTRVILGAVDEKLGKTDERLVEQTSSVRIDLNAQINRLDEKFTKKFDQIMTLLDRLAKNDLTLKMNSVS